MTNIFFVSDTHFGHRNIIEYCKRPFSSVDEMNESMIENWNSVVTNKDVVYHIGDWAFHDYHYIGRLNGRIHTVPGNHDLERLSKLRPFLTSMLPELSYLKVDSKYRFVMCHYPLESWRREYKFHLHGHTHGTSRVVANRMDVGVDATRLYRPIALEDIFRE